MYGVTQYFSYIHDKYKSKGCGIEMVVWADIQIATGKRANNRQDRNIKLCNGPPTEYRKNKTIVDRKLYQLTEIFTRTTQITFSLF